MMNAYRDPTAQAFENRRSGALQGTGAASFLVALAVSMVFLLAPASAVALKSRFVATDFEDEDRKSLENLAAHPSSARHAALIVAGYPEELLEIQKIQQRSSDEFAVLLDPYPRETQEQIWNLVRYRSLAKDIARGGSKTRAQLETIADHYPEEDREAILVEGRERYDLWVKIYALDLETEQTFFALLSALPENARTAFDDLTDHPELTSLLIDNMSWTTVLGAMYREDPAGVENHLNALHDQVVARRADEERAWAEEVADPEAAEELAYAARAFADEHGYEIEEVETTPTTNVYVTNYVDTTPYPYWFGYPYWYDVAYWYPRPIWGHVGFHFGYGHGFFSVGLPSLLFLDWYHGSYSHRHTRHYHDRHHHRSRYRHDGYYARHRPHSSHASRRHHDSRVRRAKYDSRRTRYARDRSDRLARRDLIDRRDRDRDGRTRDDRIDRRTRDGLRDDGDRLRADRTRRSDRTDATARNRDDRNGDRTRETRWRTDRDGARRADLDRPAERDRRDRKTDTRRRGERDERGERGTRQRSDGDAPRHHVARTADPRGRSTERASERGIERRSDRGLEQRATRGSERGVERRAERAKAPERKTKRADRARPDRRSTKIERPRIAKKEKLPKVDRPSVSAKPPSARAQAPSREKPRVARVERRSSTPTTAKSNSNRPSSTPKVRSSSNRKSSNSKARSGSSRRGASGREARPARQGRSSMKAAGGGSRNRGGGHRGGGGRRGGSGRRN